MSTWLVAPVEHTLLQLPRALVASVAATAFDFALLIALVEVWNWPPVIAATPSYLLGGIIQYGLCAAWVFPVAPASTARGYSLFMMLSLVGLAITWITIGALTEIAGLNYLLAKVAALALAFAWNFASRKYWVFNDHVR